MPVLLFISEIEPPGPWKRALEAQMPGLEVRIWPDLGEAGEVDYVLCWKPDVSVVGTLTRLKAIFSLGAGVDHLAGVSDQLPGVPVVRMVEPALTEGMTEYVVYQVLGFHRRMPEYAAQRARREWRELPQTRPQERGVGIMGLGVLGSEAARALVYFGFDVSGWSRTPKRLEGVTSFAGDDTLEAFLSRCEILVCMLPLTPATEGIINRETLRRLPPGAAVINVGRGGHLVEDDLLEALDSGHISGAALDVFEREPLPPDHPFWAHPRIIVTPHIASLTNPDTGARVVADNIARCEAGKALDNEIDFSRGY
ncbi:MAG: glyoxylate/hydroxypyruvate reductase A [Gammaproteobacteria bacterium]|nr:glyoxylate/hydroxypyruvate reductase A [Gammaproteobacteria bacterium]